MKESYWGYWLIILGVLIIGIMMLVNSTTTNNTQDYYSLKEATQASMIDSLDFAYYRLYGDIKMSEQKFVENFIRRIADNTNLSNEYNVEFYDLYEVPPKVSVKLTTKTNTYNVANQMTNYNVTNKIDAILEIGVEGSTYTEDAKRKCYFMISSSLMDYFNGKKVKGKSGTVQLSSSQIAALKNQYPALFSNWTDKSSLTSFKSAFASQFKDALTSVDNYSNLPDAFKTWIDNGWITIS